MSWRGKIEDRRKGEIDPKLIIAAVCSFQIRKGERSSLENVGCGNPFSLFTTLHCSVRNLGEQSNDRSLSILTKGHRGLESFFVWPELEKFFGHCIVVPKSAREMKMARPRNAFVVNTFSSKTRCR